MKRLLASSVTAAILAGGLLLPAASAHAAPRPSAAAQPTAAGLPISGVTTAGGTLTGTLSNLQLVHGNPPMLTGNLTATVTNAAGTVLGTVTDVPVTLPVIGGTGTCQVLNLRLGPLDLNLLGLRVQLNEVVLNVTAEAGPGNLLGNILCAVAHLLDNGNLAGLNGQLNRLLNALGL